MAKFLTKVALVANSLSWAILETGTSVVELTGTYCRKSISSGVSGKVGTLIDESSLSISCRTCSVFDANQFVQDNLLCRTGFLIMLLCSI